MNKKLLEYLQIAYKNEPQTLTGKGVKKLSRIDEYKIKLYKLTNF